MKSSTFSPGISLIKNGSKHLTGIDRAKTSQIKAKKCVFHDRNYTNHPIWIVV